MAATWIIGASALASTSCFPVSTEGALFFLGDVHASQGDGEIVGTGIETAAEVQFTVQVVKTKVIGWPRGANKNEIFHRRQCAAPGAGPAARHHRNAGLGLCRIMDSMK
jgi:acetamidase/formamidase